MPYRRVFVPWMGWSIGCIYSFLSGTVAAHRVSAGTRGLGRVRAAWHVVLEELPAPGKRMLWGPGHGSARLPWHWWPLRA